MDVFFIQPMMRLNWGLISYSFWYDIFQLDSDWIPITRLAFNTPIQILFVNIDFDMLNT